MEQGHGARARSRGMEQGHGAGAWSKSTEQEHGARAGVYIYIYIYIYYLKTNGAEHGVAEQYFSGIRV